MAITKPPLPPTHSAYRTAVNSALTEIDALFAARPAATVPGAAIAARSLTAADDGQSINVTAGASMTLPVGTLLPNGLVIRAATGGCSINPVASVTINGVAGGLVTCTAEPAAIYLQQLGTNNFEAVAMRPRSPIAVASNRAITPNDDGLVLAPAGAMTLTLNATSNIQSLDIAMPAAGSVTVATGGGVALAGTVGGSAVFATANTIIRIVRRAAGDYLARAL